MNDTTDNPAPQTHEYRIVPAPRRGERARGVRTGEGRFALALSRVVNHMAEAGWEFVRTDTLPCEERAGLTQTTIRHHSMLVFRRPLAGVSMVAAPQAAPPVEARAALAEMPANAVAAPAAPAAPVAVRRFWTGRGGPAPRPSATEPSPQPVAPAVVPAPQAVPQPVRRGPPPQWAGFADTDIHGDDERVIDLLAARSGRAVAAE